MALVTEYSSPDHSAQLWSTEATARPRTWPHQREFPTGPRSGIPHTPGIPPLRSQRQT
jgi:hypothetical protein